jgi:hypothetical protein
LNVLDTAGPFDVRFFFQINVTIRRGAHGVALFKDAHERLWSTEVYDIDLSPGTYEFVHSLPGLPLQPGVYSWKVSIRDDQGLFEVWDCTPEVALCVQPVTHPRDEYAGILNVPSAFYVKSGESDPVSVAPS